MALNVDCQVTDESIAVLKRQNDELRFRLGQELDAGHAMDRDLNAMKSDLNNCEREEASLNQMLKDAASVGHANQDFHAHLAELRAKNDQVLDQNRKLQADLEVQLQIKERDMQSAKHAHMASMEAKEQEYVHARNVIE